MFHAQVGFRSLDKSRRAWAEIAERVATIDRHQFVAELVVGEDVVDLVLERGRGAGSGQREQRAAAPFDQRVAAGGAHVTL